MATEEKIMIGGFMGIMSVMVLAWAIQAFIPQPQYACPICSQKFMTYQQLYDHFTSAHPSEEIEITWE